MPYARCKVKIKKPATRLLVVFMLSLLCLSIAGACGGTTVQVYSLEDAVRDGIIRDYTSDKLPEDIIYGSEIVLPTMQQLTISGGIPTPPVFPRENSLYFTHNQGDVTVFVEEYDFVSKGDVLAQLTYDVDRRHIINYEAALEYFERLEKEITNEKNKRRTEIRKARNDLSSVTDEEIRQILSLNIRLLEIDLERYTINSDLTRQEKLKEIDALKEQTGIEELTAPFDGMVINVFDGDKIWSTVRTRLMEIVDPSVIFFKIAARIEKEYPYSFIAHGDIVTLHGYIDTEPADRADTEPHVEFKARVVTDSWATGVWDFVTFWLSPVDMDGLFNSLSAVSGDDPLMTLRDTYFSLQVEYIASPYGLTVPYQAVLFDILREYRPYVLVYTGDNIEKRYVRTGYMLNGFTHIITGIDEDTKVVISP